MSRPEFVEPQLATLVDEAVDGPEWIAERKLDGIRLIAVRDGDVVELWTRNHLERSATYPELVDALRAQPSDAFVVDGEVVAFDGDVTSFARLQQRSGITDADEARRSGVAIVLYLFDLVHLDGDDLRERPLRARKSALRDRLRFADPLRFCAHRNGAGRELLEDACARGWEGLIAKRADRPYVSGRSRDWLKLKCVARQELVIGGFTEPKGSRIGIGALLVGYHGDGSADGGDGAGLVYAGRIGTGFDDETLRDLRHRLDPRTRATSPFRDAPGGGDTHWVTPDLVCEVGFTEWTAAGRLRHPRYLGLRHDKDAADVVRERARGAP